MRVSVTDAVADSDGVCDTLAVTEDVRVPVRDDDRVLLGVRLCERDMVIEDDCVRDCVGVVDDVGLNDFDSLPSSEELGV